MDTAIFYNKISVILEKYSFNGSNDWVKAMFLPQKKSATFSSTGDLVADLFNDFNFRDFQVPGFWFNSQPAIDNRYISIGARDTDNICIDRQTQEILLFTEDDELIYYLAGSLSDYLSVLLLLIDYHLPGFIGHTYTERENNDLLKELKKMLINPKYFPYYDDTYGTFLST